MTPGAGDNFPTPILRLLQKLGLGPSQPTKVRGRDTELPRRRRDVAIMLGQHTRNPSKVKIGADVKHRRPNPASHHTQPAKTPQQVACAGRDGGQAAA